MTATGATGAAGVARGLAARAARTGRATVARRLLAAGFVVLAGAPSAGAQVPPPPAPPSCDRAAAAPGDRRIAGDGLDLAWRASPALSVGRPFAVLFALCPRDGASVAIDRVKVDAWMPAHRHGMNYAPTLTGAAGGPWRAEGLLFHMPGAWQLVFELRLGGRALRLVDDVAVR